jgi:glycosyltransferase involved in cell wall biosynthesis
VKLLHVVASYLPAIRYGGTIVSVHGLCRALADRGHDVHVYTTSVNGDANSPVPHEVAVDMDGVKVWYFSSPRFRRLYWAPSMKRQLRRHVSDFDVLHTHAIYLWPLWTAARTARDAGVPYVVSPRGMLERALIEEKSAVLKAALIGLIERRTLEGASAIHVTSARELQETSAFGFRLPPIYEIPNGVSLDSELRRPSAAIATLAARQPFVLFLGRISWKKGLDRLLRAFALVDHARLVIAGNDEEQLQPSLETLARQLGVGDRVIFTGGVGNADKAALLRTAQCLVLPSYSENFGNVVVEAMAEACPVIVTPEVGLAPVVQSSGAGIVVNGNIEDLSAAISRVIVDPQCRVVMGQRGKAAAAGFSWPVVAEQMEHLYASVVRQRSHAS